MRRPHRGKLHPGDLQKLLQRKQPKTSRAKRADADRSCRHPAFCSRMKLSFWREIRSLIRQSNSLMRMAVPSPTLRPFAFPAGWTSKLLKFRHFKAHLILNDFTQSDIRCAKVRDISHHRVGTTPAAGIELAHAS